MRILDYFKDMKRVFRVGDGLTAMVSSESIEELVATDYLLKKGFEMPLSKQEQDFLNEMKTIVQGVVNPRFDALDSNVNAVKTSVSDLRNEITPQLVAIAKKLGI